MKIKISILLLGLLIIIPFLKWEVLPAKAAETITFTEFPIVTGTNVNPYIITSGPDGNLWFTGSSNNASANGVIGRITPSGTITEFPLPRADSNPYGITTGPDGNLWFTEENSNKIGRITSNGVITEFPIPSVNSNPQEITTGPDGNLWFTEIQSGKIGRITTSGIITEFLVPSANAINLEGITTGPDGNLWFTIVNNNTIGRITPSGTVTEFPIPTLNENPHGITSGPDGNLWFAEGDKIGKITPNGAITMFSVPTAGSGISVGPDGNLWFTEYNGNKIGSITTSGSITEFPLPTNCGFSFGCVPLDITSGQDGNLWFTEIYGKAIGRVNLTSITTSPTPTLTPTNSPSPTPTLTPTPTPMNTPTPSPNAAATYTQIDLGSLGGGNTKAYKINNSNQIVGQSNINGQVHHAFLWQNGHMTDLGTLGGSNSIAYGINNHGQIVGESQIASDSATHAFLWETGHMKDIGVITRAKYKDLGVPDVLIGYANSFNGDLNFNTTANDINDNGEIVGTGNIDLPIGEDRFGNEIDYNHAFLWKNGEIVDLQKDMVNVKALLFTDSAIESHATAINDSGQIVGTMIFPARPPGDSFYINQMPQESFLWKNGLITVTTNVPTGLIESTDINNSGQITLSNWSTGYPGGIFVSGYVVTNADRPDSCNGTGGGQASEAMSLNRLGWVFGVKAQLGGTDLGQGYFICKDGVITDFGMYPNHDYTILGQSDGYIKGGINDEGDAVVDNILFKRDQVAPTLTPTPIPYNNGYKSSYNNNFNTNYNNLYKAVTGIGKYFNTNFNNWWNNNYNNGWKASF